MPATGVAPSVTVKVVSLMAEASMAPLKVAVGRVLTATSVASSTGVVNATVGGAAVAAVVKVQVWFAASASPSVSVAPVVIVAVCSALGLSAAAGVSVTVLVTSFQ